MEKTETLYLKDADIGRKLGIAESAWPYVKAKFESEGFPKPGPCYQKALLASRRAMAVEPPRNFQ